MTKKRKKISGDSPLFNEVTLTPNQKILHEKIINNTITFVYGPAGTSKTFTVCYAALKMITEKSIDKIIITKPVEESGERLGFLPGTVEEKIGPYFESFFCNMSEMADPLFVESLVQDKTIQCRPLAHMRGATYNDSIMILDEAQNCTYEQLILFITRLGENSKMIIAGDVTQRDIEKKKIALPDFIEMYKNIEGVGVHLFTKEDIVRNPLLVKLTEIYEDWKDKKNL